LAFICFGLTVATIYTGTLHTLDWDFYLKLQTYARSIVDSS